MALVQYVNQTTIRCWFLCLAFFAGSLWAQAPAADASGIPVVNLGKKTDSISLDGKLRFWLDPSGTASIESVAALPDSAFTALPPRSQFIRDNQGVWFRLQLNAQDDASDWFLSIRQITTDHVDWYTQDAQGRWQVQRAGTAVAVADWPIADFRPTFSIASRAGQHSTAYLRIADPVGSYANIRIAPQATWLEQRQFEIWMLGLYFGATAVILWLCLLNGISYRESIWVSYAAYCLSIAMAQASLIGLAGQYFHPHSPWLSDISSYIWAGLACIFGLIFGVHASSVYALARRWAHLVWLYCAAIAGVLLLVIDHRNDLTMGIMYASFVGALLLVPLTFCIAWARGDRFSPIAMLAFVPAVVSAAPQMAYNFNWIDRSLATEYALTLGVTLESVLMLYFLHRRSRLQAVTRSRLTALGLSDSLTGLFTLAEAVSRLDNMLKRARNTDKAVGAMLVTLVNFEAIRQSHGHEIAETALVVAAQHIKSICKALDTAGRVENNRFLLCIEGPTSENNMKHVGASLIANGLRPSPFLPPDVALDYGLIVSVASGIRIKAHEVYRQLNAVAAEMPANQGRRIVVHPLVRKEA